MGVVIRELGSDEFVLVDRLWEQYRGQETDRATDRVFGGFVDGTLAGTARVRHHPDGLEVDGVFVSEAYRSAGLARRLVQAVIDRFGHGTLWLHSTIPLIGFYGTFGFVPVKEEALPPTIRERLAFCFGEMVGCGVCPMRRDPPS
ncbi:MAG TPA: GNAT family N-acetyltransferase [Methanoregulaceae archaeon]|nr:GNAT family N-acetyltransferase [Methanoregulaceae archaeon]